MSNINDFLNSLSEVGESINSKLMNAGGQISFSAGALWNLGSGGGDLPSSLTINTIPYITGTKANGETLTLNTGVYDSTVSLAFQWLSDGVAISGATTSTYTIPTVEIANTTITCRVTVTYGINSLVLIAVLNETGNPADSFSVTTSPVLSGTASVGQVLTTSNGVYDPVATAVSYQWIRNVTPISGQTNQTYTLTSDDFSAGNLITYCRVTVTIGNDTITLKSTFPTAGGDIPASFTVLTEPLITSSGGDTVALNDVLTLNINTATYFNPVPDIVSYQWLRNGSTLSGATNTTYTAVAGDVGQTLSCRVTITYGINTLILLVARIVDSGNLPATITCTALPYITGDNLIGGVLTLFQGTYTASSNPSYTITQQWLSNGNAISGATNTTYTVTSATASTTITCRVNVNIDSVVGDIFYLIATKLITETSRIPFYTEVLASNNPLFELHPRLNLLDAGGAFPDVGEEVASWKDSSGKYVMTFPSGNRPVYSLDETDNRQAYCLNFNTSKYGTLPFTDLNGTNLPFTVYIVGRWPATLPASDITLGGFTTGANGSGASIIRSWVRGSSDGRLVSTTGSTSIGGDGEPVGAVAPLADSRFIYCLTSNGEKQNALYVSEGGLVVSIDQARSFDSGSRNLNEFILGARRDTAIQQFSNCYIYHVIVLGTHTYNPTSVINSLGQAYKFNLSQPRLLRTFEPDDCFYFDAEATTHVSMLNTSRTMTEVGTWVTTDDGLNGLDLAIKPTTNTDYLELANASVPPALFLKNNRSFTVGCAFKFVNNMQPTGTTDLNLLGLNLQEAGPHSYNWNLYFRRGDVDNWQIHVRYTSATGALATWDTNLLPIFTSSGGNDNGGWNIVFFGREKTSLVDNLFISLNGSAKSTFAYPQFTSTNLTNATLRLGALANLYASSARNGFSWFAFKSDYAITDAEIADTINSRVFQGAPDRSRPPFRL